LCEHECIAIRMQDGSPSVWVFELLRGGRGRSIRIAARGGLVVAQQYDAVRDAALMGLGITVVFSHAVLKDLRSGDLRALLPNWRIFSDAIEDNTLYLSYAQDRYQTFAARRLIEFLRPRLLSAKSPSILRQHFAV